VNHSGDRDGQHEVSTIKTGGDSLTAVDVACRKAARWDDELRRCASRYLAEARLPDDDSPRFVPVTDELGMLVADLYVAMRHEPENPLVAASYRQYVREVTEQYEFAVTRLGLRVEPWPHASEPYRDSRQMVDDVRNNRHLYVLATHVRWGEAETCHADHPMLTPTGIVADGVELVANDLFRVVHDVFGHAMEGHQFGPIGEEKAWLEHYGMFSPLARPALTAETRGQTCWMYFGPQTRASCGALIGKGEPGWVPVPQRPFAEQKAGLLPAEVSGVRLTRERETGGVHAQRLTNWRPDTHHALRTSRQPPEVADHLADAYAKTTFRVLAKTGPIDVRIGQCSPALDTLVRREGFHCWAYLTAWNPGGQALPPTENQRRTQALEHQLRATGTTVLPGTGIGDDPNWPPEDSLLAVGLDRATAVTLATAFDQDAIVVGDLDAPAELLWCR
jgi:uncharacterized protein DUF3293